VNFNEFRESPMKWVVIGAVALVIWFLMKPRAAAPASYSLSDPIAGQNANTAIQANAANASTAMQANVASQSNALAAMVQFWKISAAKAVAINTNASALAHDQIMANTQVQSGRTAVKLASVQGASLITLAGINADTQKVMANQAATAQIEQANAGVQATQVQADSRNLGTFGNFLASVGF
jgi:hypothetical protein